MDEDRQFVAEDLARALAKLLIRKGIVTPHDMLDASERENDGTERGEMVAHLLQVAIMEAHDAGGPPLSESERRAQFQREQMRVRTAMIDGGKTD